MAAKSNSKLSTKAVRIIRTPAKKNPAAVTRSTAWGTIQQDDELEWTLNGKPVMGISDKADTDTVFWLVTAEPNGIYRAYWIDENGEARTQNYRSAAAAIRKADNSWGR